MDKKIRELLYRSFDESLSEREAQLLDEALAQSKHLRAEKNRITAMRERIGMSAAHSFRPFFADRVMQQIQAPNKKVKNGEIFSETLFALFRPVALGAAVLMIALLSYNMIKSQRLSLAGAFAEPEVTLEEVFDPAVSLAME